MARLSSIPKQRKYNTERKFKSGLEEQFAQKLISSGIEFKYEPDKFKYVIQSSYTPDFRIGPSIYIETKGYFSGANRSRLLCFKEQYPAVKVYLVFQKPNNYIDNKTKRTTYAQWCDRHSIGWSSIDKPIPKAWLDND